MENFEYETNINGSCETLQIKFKVNNKIYGANFSIELLNATDKSTNSLKYYQNLVQLKSATKVFKHILKYYPDTTKFIPFNTSEKNIRLCKEFFFEE